MGRYGTAALVAVARVGKSEDHNPVTAWYTAVKEVFPTSKSQQRKGCPRGAFLGLCEEGLIRGVPRGRYTRSKLNKSYAVRAIDLIQADVTLTRDLQRLWQKIMGGTTMSENGQMDVVAALWDAGLIQPTDETPTRTIHEPTRT